MDNLPSAGGTHSQERKSAVKFEGCVPGELFLIRDETGGDYGVDRILEVLLSTGSATNIRVYVQLKSTTDDAVNGDGSFSFAVQLSNLNYLLNQTNAVYAIYREHADTFMWEFATAIFKTAREQGVDCVNPNQETFTYRFNKRLVRRAFEAIHDSAIRNGKVIRSMTERLSLAEGSRFDASIDVSNAVVITSEQIVRMVKDYGMSLIVAGRVKDLQELLARVPSSYRSDTMFSLVGAYGLFHAGRYLEAISWVPKGKARRNLGTTYELLAEYLEVTLGHLLGMLPEDMYSKRLTEVEANAGESFFGLQLQAEKLRTKALLERSPERMREVVTELDKVFKRLSDHPKSSAGHKIDIRVSAWELEGLQTQSAFLHEVMTLRMREAIGYPLPIGVRMVAANNLIARSTAWFSQFRELEEDARRFPVVWSRLLLAKALIQMLFIWTNRVLQIDDGGTQEQERAMLNGFVEDLDRVIRTAEDLGMPLVIERAQLLKADALEGMGSLDDATALVEMIRSEAAELGNLDLERKADQFLSGQSMFRMASALVTTYNDDNVDDDGYLLSLDSHERVEMAKDIARSVGIPLDDRLPIVVKEVEWIARDAADRGDWCRHIGTIQDLSHASSPESAYSVDPLRKVVCHRHGYESEVPGVDRESLQRNFRVLHCDTCPDRSPGTLPK